jgi:ethanolamine utilization protein EutQ (cupin superfamily)
MPKVIESPTRIAAAGIKPKQIEEFVGHVNSHDDRLSVARMVSPAGWEEPGQRPEFLEVTFVLRGAVHVEHATGTTVATDGQAVVTEPGEWIRYSTPQPEGAEYIAVCLPAFAPSTVHRDESFGGPVGSGTRAPRLIARPTTVEAAGNKPIRIDEIAGRVNSHDDRLSIARLFCPHGWIEPAQQPEFLEVTLVLSGSVCVESEGTRFIAKQGQAIVTEPGERIQYSTPDEDADYVAVCLPAFSLESARRDPG